MMAIQRSPVNNLDIMSTVHCALAPLLLTVDKVVDLAPVRALTELLVNVVDQDLSLLSHFDRRCLRGFEGCAVGSALLFRKNDVVNLKRECGGFNISTSLT